MKSVILAISLCAMVFVSGCAQVQAKFEADVKAATAPDFQNAAAISTAGGDTDGALCANELYAYMSTWPSATAAAKTVDVSQAKPGDAGVASGIALIRLAEMKAEQSQFFNLDLPPIPKQTVKDCLFVLQDTVTQANVVLAQFGLKAAALASGLKIPKIPVKP